MFCGIDTLVPIVLSFHLHVSRKPRCAVNAANSIFACAARCTWERNVRQLCFILVICIIFNFFCEQMITAFHQGCIEKRLYTCCHTHLKGIPAVFRQNKSLSFFFPVSQSAD